MKITSGTQGMTATGAPSNKNTSASADVNSILSQIDSYSVESGLQIAKGHRRLLEIINESKSSGNEAEIGKQAKAALAKLLTKTREIDTSYFESVRRNTSGVVIATKTEQSSGPSEIDLHQKFSLQIQMFQPPQEFVRIVSNDFANLRLDPDIINVSNIVDPNVMPVQTLSILREYIAEFGDKLAVIDAVGQHFQFEPAATYAPIVNYILNGLKSKT